MDTQRNHNGLVARRKTKRKSYRNAQVGFGFISLLIAFALLACKKEAESKSTPLASQVAKSDTLKPRVDIKVNRRYDEKGNIIGFDSTYSTYYSNVMGDTSRMDSLMGSFDSFFNSRHSSFLRDQFNPLFFNDSLRYPDFFHNDFFLRRYELNDRYMRGMMKRMDSIKNDFYKRESAKNRKSSDS